jgi:hypothetical protein
MWQNLLGQHIINVMHLAKAITPPSPQMWHKTVPCLHTATALACCAQQSPGARLTLWMRVHLQLRVQHLGHLRVLFLQCQRVWGPALLLRPLQM